MKDLTAIQRKVLQAMIDRGGTWPESSNGGRWVWNTETETRRIIEALAKKGAVERTESGFKVSPLGSTLAQEVAE